jgi:hypothetical protein
MLLCKEHNMFQSWHSHNFHKFFVVSTKDSTLPAQFSTISLPILQDTQEHFGTGKVEGI